MIEILSADEALHLYETLPMPRQLATLCPSFVAADAARDTSLEAFFLVFKDGVSFWLHGVHRGSIDRENFFDFQSAYGYGGPLTNNDDPIFLAKAYTAYSEWCRANNILAEFVRLHPMAASWQRYGGTVRDDRLTVAVDLSPDDITVNYSKRCKRSIKKACDAKLGVSIVSNENIAGKFASFYRSGMTEIGANPFYLFNDRYFERLSKLPNSKLIVARLEHEWLSAALLLVGSETVEYHLGASSPKGRSLSASSLVHHEAARYAQGAGAKFYYLGGGTTSAQDDSLFIFKSGFSDKRIPFRYGFSIFQPEKYQQLKFSRNSDSSRVLFYR